MGRESFFSYHEEGPDGVVEEDDGGSHKHGETDELVELGGKLAFASCLRRTVSRLNGGRHHQKRQQRNKTNLGNE